MKVIVIGHGQSVIKIKDLIANSLPESNVLIVDDSHLIPKDITIDFDSSLFLNSEMLQEVKEFVEPKPLDLNIKGRRPPWLKSNRK